MPPLRALLPWMFVLPMLMAEDGIPVNEPLVIAKCGSCHTRDEQGNMQRISWERATPEAWQAALGRMMRLNRVVLTPAEARSIKKYLSTDHGLAPDESNTLPPPPERPCRGGRQSERRVTARLRELSCSFKRAFMAALDGGLEAACRATCRRVQDPAERRNHRFSKLRRLLCTRPNGPLGAPAQVHRS